MRHYLSFFCCLFTVAVFSQKIERKIIIQNNSFFYTTIHEEFQIGTLHTGNFSKPFSSSKNLALPAGRNFTKKVNPFSWDLADSLMYAINFLNHPLNSRNDALKRFKLSSLQEWSDRVKIMDMIMDGAEKNTFAYNDPYKFTMRLSNILNGLYFDGIVLHDSSYTMVIVNNNKMSIWNYAKNAWSHGEVQDFEIDGFFSLFEKNKQLYIILNNGTIYKVTKKQVNPIPELITNRSLKDNTLILNRDKNTVQLIKNNELNMNTPLNELIEKKGIYIL